LVRWLDEIKHDAQEIFLMGDLFDWWFEHRYTAPQGYVRVLGKLAELTDAGIPITLFTGNHDMWMFGYLERELNVKIVRKPIVREFGGKKFFLAHGDGLGPGDAWYKLYKWFFISPFWQWCFARLHPNFSMWLGNFFSRRSRISKGDSDLKYLGDDKEFLSLFCKEKLQTEHYDYFIFGHRHLPLNIEVGKNSRYLNLGEWVNYRSFVVFGGGEARLEYFEGNTTK
jgi:UDP-2,3-diacylglucosamine hydrolase